MVKIFSFHNNSLYIEKQSKLLNHFVRDEYEFTVINSADSYDMRDQITEECARLGVKQIVIPYLNTHSAASTKNSVPLQYLWEHYLLYEKRVTVIMDSDMFLLRPYSFIEILGDNDIAAIINKRKHIWYPWNGLSIFSGELPDKNTMNFREGCIDGVKVDVSGNIHHYLKQHKELNVKELYDGGFICSRNKNRNLLPPEILDLYSDSYLSQFFEQAFFHFRGGSNWNNQDAFQQKMHMLDILITKALNDELRIPLDFKYKFNECDSIIDVDYPVISNEYTRLVNGKWIGIPKKQMILAKIKEIATKI